MSSPYWPLLASSSENPHENQVFYRANLAHPIFAELHALLAKTVGVFHALQEALTPLAEGIEFAFVYGSFARGEEQTESDVDLMVAGEVTLDELLSQVSPVELQLKRPINPTIYGRGELRTKIHSGNHFLKAVQSGPLVSLIGSEREFREIR